MGRRGVASPSGSPSLRHAGATLARHLKRRSARRTGNAAGAQSSPSEDATPRRPIRVRVAQVCLCALGVAAAGCTYPSARLAEVPAGTPVTAVIRDFGAPREDNRDGAGWMAHTCPAGTRRALAYDSWGGPLGSVMTRLTHYDLTIVCVDAGDRVSQVLASQY